jgi:hypothetical protein
MQTGQLNHTNIVMIYATRQRAQSFSYVNKDDICTAMILEEAEKLYNELTTKLTNEVMTAAAAIKASSLPLPITNNRKNETYKIEEPRYNNQS